MRIIPARIALARTTDSPESVPRLLQSWSRFVNGSLKDWAARLSGRGRGGSNRGQKKPSAHKCALTVKAPGLRAPQGGGSHAQAH